MRSKELLVALILGGIIIISIAGCAGRPLQISSTDSILTSVENVNKGKKIPIKTFDIGDEIVFYAYVKWDDPTQRYGIHKVMWNWYKNGKLVSTATKDLEFNTTPYTLWTHRTASVLGSGHFEVETIVEGKIVESAEFDIKK